MWISFLKCNTKLKRNQLLWLKYSLTKSFRYNVYLQSQIFSCNHNFQFHILFHLPWRHSTFIAVHLNRWLFYANESLSWNSLSSLSGSIFFFDAPFRTFTRVSSGFSLRTRGFFSGAFIFHITTGLWKLIRHVLIFGFIISIINIIWLHLYFQI